MPPDFCSCFPCKVVAVKYLFDLLFQVQKILTMYTPASEYEPRVPSKVIRAVVAKASKQTPDPANLMMSIQFSTAVNFPFTPSAVEFEKIELPDVLNLTNVKVI